MDTLKLKEECGMARIFGLSINCGIFHEYLNKTWHLDCYASNFLLWCQFY